MKRPILSSTLFWLRMAVLLVTSVLIITVAKARRDVAPIVKDNVTVRQPVNPQDYKTEETKKLAGVINDLYKKVSSLESESIANGIMRSVFDYGWVVYFLLFAPLTVTILQSAERYIEDKAKKKSV